MSKKILFRIKAQDELMIGLDYNKRLNIIASSDKANKLWNLNDHSLIRYHKSVPTFNKKVLKLIP